MSAFLSVNDVLQCFTAMSRDTDGNDVITMGCMDRSASAQLSCRVGSQTYVAIECCNNASFCNRHLLPTYATGARHYHLTNDDHRAATAAGKLITTRSAATFSS